MKRRKTNEEEEEMKISANIYQYVNNEAKKKVMKWKWRKA